MENNLEKIFDFLQMVGGLKTTYRFGAQDAFKGDSSADHSWRLALMVFMLASELDLRVDLVKSMKMALVHDLAESVTGDIDARDIKENRVTKEEKQAKELEAMEKICSVLPPESGKEIYGLWEEYENVRTKEAIYIKALDKIETLSHLAELGHTKYDDTELIGIYGNNIFKNIPELKNVVALVKKRLKVEFAKGGFSWEEKYEDYF